MRSSPAGRGDVALIQLAHNDKTTTAEQYRANLTELVERVRARGATPVMVTPIVRLRFTNGVINPVGLIVTDLADLPAEMRAVAALLDVPLIDLTERSRASWSRSDPSRPNPSTSFVSTAIARTRPSTARVCMPTSWPRISRASDSSRPTSGGDRRLSPPATPRRRSPRTCAAKRSGRNGCRGPRHPFLLAVSAARGLP